MCYCTKAIHSADFQLISSTELLKCNQGTKGRDSTISLSCISIFSKPEGAPLHHICAMPIRKELHSLSLFIVLDLNSKDLLLTSGLLLTIPHTLYIPKNINAVQTCKIYLHYKIGVHFVKAKIATGNHIYNS